MLRKLLVVLSLITLASMVVSCGLGPFAAQSTATPTKVARKATATPKKKAAKTATPVTTDQVEATVESIEPTPPEDQTPPSEDEVAATATAIAEAESAPQAQTSEPVTIGQTQQTGNYTVTVNSLRRESSGSSDPPEGYEYVILNVTIQDTGSGNLPVAFIMFQLSDANDTFDLTDGADVSETIGGMLDSGESQTGDIAWEVPTGTQGLTLYFDSPLSDGEIAFNLGV
jgi:hypothetical protein